MRLATPLILRPLADPSLALLWGGLATSSIGDQLFAVVLSWVAVGAFGRAAGYLSASQAGVTLLVALFAGRWADRREHRGVMIAADIARAAVLMVAVAAWMAHGGPPAWSLVACVAVLAGGQAVFRPALQAVLPTLVAAPNLLPAANGLIDTTERIARLLGPGLIGIASAVVPLVHFVSIDAATFLISAAAMLAITRLHPAEPAVAQPRGTIWESLTRGFRAARTNPILGFLLGATGIINGSWYSATYLGVPLMIEHNGITGPGGSGLAAFGLVISAYGSTNLLGTLVVGNLGVARRPGRFIFGGNIVGATGLLLVGIAGMTVSPAWMLPAFCAGMAVVAIGGPMQDITVATLRQSALPRADLPAAVRAFMVMNNLGMLVALLAAPSVIGLVGVPVAVMGCGLGYLLVGVVGWLRFSDLVMPAR